MAKQAEPATGFFDQLFKTIGGAIADARTELIDRGWFGRHPHGTGPEHSTMAQQLGWTQAQAPPGMEEKAQAWDTLCREIVTEIGREDAHAIEHGQDQDIDR